MRYRTYSGYAFHAGTEGHTNLPRLAAAFNGYLSSMGRKPPIFNSAAIRFSQLTP